MRIFEFHNGEVPNILNFEKFTREKLKEINEDKELIEKAKETNKNFYKKIKKITSNEENELYIGTMLLDELKSQDRFIFIKNIDYNNTKYDIEIDLLKREMNYIKL